MNWEPSRVTRATINLTNLQHNFSIARDAAPGTNCMAIIKANGYGHGMVEIARALSSDINGANAFGVASLQEAISLREAGIAQRIVLLEGFIRSQDLNLIRGYNLETVIHSEYQLEILEASLPIDSQEKAIRCWLKLDTGMHRLGFAPEKANQAYQRLLNTEAVARPLHIMSHLANADDRDDTLTVRQCSQFLTLLGELGFNDEKSIANSAGILGWQQQCQHVDGDWLRPGIMLYGVSPFVDSTAQQHNLKPVMTLSSELIAVNYFKQGEAVGYGGSYVCEQDMSIGVVAIGYGDGYPRHVKSGTPVLVNHQPVPLVGRVSMDMITVDLRKCPDAKVGDRVVLWGDGLPVEDIANSAGTIGYELLCGVTRRVDFCYRY